MKHGLRVERTIEALAASQFGVFSRTQAIAAGVTRSMIRPPRHVRRVVWLVLPTVLRVTAVPRTKRQSAMAAALWSRRTRVARNRSGTLESRRRDDGRGRCHGAPRIADRDRLTSSFIAFVDLLPADIGAARTDCGDVRVADSDRPGRGRRPGHPRDRDRVGTSTQAVLRRPAPMALGCTALGTGRPGSASLRALLDQRTLGRTDSGWEVRTAQVLVAAGLPAPTRQHSVKANGKEIAGADLAYPEAKVILEYDSDEWHSGTVRRHRDAARRNQLQVARLDRRRGHARNPAKPTTLVA